MPESVQSAYLILLGQVVLIATSAIFGIPFFLTANDLASSELSGSTIYYMVFIFSACTIMIMNLMIGWAASKEASKNSDLYNNKMFILDLLIIVCFFSMNNVITFSFGDTLSVKNSETMGKIIKDGINFETIAITSASLYFITAIFLYACKLWNLEYYKLSKTKDTDRYEKDLWVAIVVMVVITFIALFNQDSPYVLAATFIVWVINWIYVNIDWIKSNFLYT